MAAPIGRMLRADGLAEGVFIMSNSGMFGVEGFFVIIYRLQAAVLAVGVARK